MTAFLLPNDIVKRYPVLQGRSDAYISAFLETRLDKAKCGPGSKPCGERCIKKEWECQKDKTQQTLSQARSGIHFGAGTGLGLMMGAAAIAGIAATAKQAKQVRDEYRSGFGQSAEIAKEKAKDIVVPKLGKNIHTVAIAIGGFGTEDAFSESTKLVDNLKKSGVDKGVQFHPMAYPELNVASPITEKDLADPVKAAQKIKASVQEATSNFIKTVFKEKQNPIAIKAAAQVLAYHRENPDKEYQIISHSGGGFAAQEAYHILKEAGVKIKATAIGTPDVGILPPSPDDGIVTAVGDGDQLLRGFAGAAVGKKTFRGVTSHGQDQYFENPDFQAFIRGRLQPRRVDSFRFDKKPNCTKGKPCKTESGDIICIPKSAKCKSEEKAAIQPTAPSAKSGLDPGTIKAIASLTAMAGVAPATYLAARAAYRANIPHAAKEAQARAEKIDPKTLPNFKGKDGIFLVMPGFSGQLGPTQRKTIEAKFGRDFAKFAGNRYGTHLLPNDKFNIGQDVPDYVPPNWNPNDLKTYKPAPVPKKKLVGNLVNTLIDSSLVKRRNEQAIDATAHLLAMEKKFREQNPGKEPVIKASGYSAGGIILSDANMQLRTLGKNVDMLFFGSPYLGVTDQTDNITRVFSKNDALLGFMPEGKAKLFNDVVEHTGYHTHPKVVKLAQEFFDKGLKKNREDALEVIGVNQRQLYAQLKVILDKAYTDKVDAISQVKVSPGGDITGLFRDGYKVAQFKISANNKLTFKLATPSRTDSVEVREDTKKRKCTKGIPCKGGCIARNKSCDLELNEVASPAEVKKLKLTAINYQLEQNAAAKPVENSQPPVQDYELNSETGKPYTIRELKKIASQKGVSGYSEMRTEELKSALRTIKNTSPAQQGRLARTLGRDRSSATRAINAAGLRGKEKRVALEANRTWKNLQAIAKFATSQPVGWGVAAIGAFLMGASIRSFERAKEEYRSTFKENAQQAQEKAVSLSPKRPGNRSNITFVVGSHKDEGAEGMIKDLKESVDKSNDPADKWLADGQFFVPFNLKESGARPGSDDIEGAISGLKDYANNFLKKKDQDAVDLAAQIYAYGIQRTSDTRKQRAMDKLETSYERMNKNKQKIEEAAAKVTEGDTAQQEKLQRELTSINAAMKENRRDYHQWQRKADKGDRPLANKGKNINILAHSRGGQTAKTAMEYLARMSVPGEPTGKEILEQVNLVMLGTPHFGFTENVTKRQRTLISAQDPIAYLPVFGEGARQEWISTIKGHSAKHYMEDARARESMRQAFGYYEDSLLQRRRRERKKTDSLTVDELIAQVIAFPEHSILTVHVRNDAIEGKALIDGQIWSYQIQEEDWTATLDSEATNLLFSVSSVRMDKGVKCGGGFISQGEKCRAGKSDKYKAERIKAKFGRGAIGGTIGGIGNDLERAAIKTGRLFKQAKNKLTGKQQSDFEKVTDELKFQIQHLGIIAGKGGVTRALRGLDEKLIDLREGVEGIPDTVKEKFEAVIEAVKKQINRLRPVKSEVAHG